MFETEAIRENYELGVLAGEAREQQRIIKLLELEQFKQGDNWEATTTNEIIVLIKGEK